MSYVHSWARKQKRHMEHATQVRAAAAARAARSLPRLDKIIIKPCCTNNALFG